MPYVKLSSFYFIYFSLFGLFIPYLGLYYKFLGFNAIEIGQLSAVFVATKLISPNLLGWLADKTGLKIFWVKWCTFLTFILLILFANQTSFYTILFSVFLFSFFFHSSLPIFESYTFNALKKSNLAKANYGKIRLWGSVGFIFAVLVVGWLLDKTTIANLPVFIVAFAFISWLLVLFLNEKKYIYTAVANNKFWLIIKQPQVIALLLISLLVQFSHGSYYGFYSIFLNEAGFTKTAIAIFWSIGVVAEIVIFLFMLPLFKKFSANILLKFSLWATLIRWLIIPLGLDNVILLFIAQLLHAASYALFHAAAIYLIDSLFVNNNQTKGQALYASLSHGLGGALGLLLAGYVWFSYGASVSFFINALMVVLALLIAYKYLYNININN